MLLLVRKEKEKIEKGVIYLLKKWDNYCKENNIQLENQIEYATKDFVNIYGVYESNIKKHIKSYYKNNKKENYRAVNEIFSSMLNEIINAYTYEKDITKAQIKIKNNYFLFKKDRLNKIIINILYLYNINISKKKIKNIKFVPYYLATINIDGLLVDMKKDFITLDFSKCKKKK